MDDNAELLERIDAYCKANGIAESTFGARAVNDGKLVARLRAGNSITLRTLKQIDALLSAPAPQVVADGAPV